MDMRGCTEDICRQSERLRNLSSACGRLNLDGLADELEEVATRILQNAGEINRLVKLEEAGKESILDKLKNLQK